MISYAGSPESLAVLAVDDARGYALPRPNAQARYAAFTAAKLERARRDLALERVAPDAQHARVAYLEAEVAELEATLADACREAIALARVELDAARLERPAAAALHAYLAAELEQLEALEQGRVPRAAAACQRPV